MNAILKPPPPAPLEWNGLDPSGHLTWMSRAFAEALGAVPFDALPSDECDVFVANPCGRLMEPYPGGIGIALRARVTILLVFDWFGPGEWTWLSTLAKAARGRLIVAGPAVPPLCGPHDQVDGSRFRVAPSASVVPLPCAVDPDEFRPLGLSRTRAWSPGTVDAAGETYARRIAARRAIALAGLPTWTANKSTPEGDSCYGTSGRAGRAAFNDMLNECRLACVEPSTLGVPLAKFFEVAATGTAMYAVPFANAASLGFRPLEHYIPDCGGDDAQMAGDMKGWYEKPDALASIGLRAREWAVSFHSQAVRRRQIQAIADAAVRNDPMEAVWEDGRLRLDGAFVA